jgi:hypothetical protein
MNQLALIQGLENYNSACSDLIKMAERELAALFNTVKELFGAHQADLSAEDWLHELKTTNGLPSSAREWRFLSVKVVARIASRLEAAGAAA